MIEVNDALSAEEAAAALDPDVGEGTPETAPFLTPFDADDELEDDDEDAVEDPDDLEPIDV